MTRRGTLVFLLFRTLGPFIRALLAVTALLLITTLWTDPSWAQTKVLRVGILNPNDEPDDEMRDWLSGMHFYQTLGEHGWIEGKNVIFEYRHAGGGPTHLAEPAAELVQLKVDVLFLTGGPSVRAVFAATQDIPIVAHDLEIDPLAAGYARSYSRPGRNLTGLFLDSPELAGKWLELLKAMVPRLSRVVVLWDVTSGRALLDALQNAAPALGMKLQVREIHTPADIDKAPSAFGGRAQAIIAVPSPMLYNESGHLAKLAAKHRLPGTSMFVPFADAGGLLAYGPNLAATIEQCAVLVAKVLDGAKPGDLPIERPTKFEFVLNVKTARDLHLTVPDTVLLRADRLIK
jgi:putative ABC transport system substrate-binding protein